MNEQINAKDAALAKEIEEQLNSEVTFANILGAEKVMKKTRKLRMGTTAVCGAIGGYATYTALAASWFVPGSTILYGTIWGTVLYSSYGYACSTGALEAMHHSYIGGKKKKNRRIWKGMKNKVVQAKDFMKKKPVPEPS